MQVTQTQIANKYKVLFLLLFTLNGFSQTIETISKVDTVYIYFKNNSIQEERKKIIGGNSKFYKNHLSYSFGYDPHNTIIFNYNDYMSFDLYEKDIKNDVKIVKKRFLKKNKNIILDIDFFLKNGFKETFFAALYGKIVYLIDKEDTKKGKIKLKQVSVMSNYIEE